jgi:hypothetical protein
MASATCRARQWANPSGRVHRPADGTEERKTPRIPSPRQSPAARSPPQLGAVPLVLTGERGMDPRGGLVPVGVDQRTAGAQPASFRVRNASSSQRLWRTRWPLVELTGRSAPSRRAATDRQDTPALSGANLTRCRLVRETRLRSHTRPAAHARARSCRTIGKVAGPVPAPGSGSGKAGCLVPGSCAWGAS